MINFFDWLMELSESPETITQFETSSEFVELLGDFANELELHPSLLNCAAYLEYDETWLRGALENQLGYTEAEFIN